MAQNFLQLNNKSEIVLFGLSNSPKMITKTLGRLLTRSRMRGHITPVLASLHCIPIRFRINVKILQFVFKALNGLAAAYWSELLCTPVTPTVLRSSCLSSVAPRCRLKLRGDRVFAVAAPR
ncbi:hypothetical protein N1851_021756 [Merluccius polli]|uniref:Uncharacterized protein n=1 Tax=Merluccius polli TaxID=89951 RepID=A0AA47MJL2_MERPO|nr:hypothetical protein N1851_021756 [Merluccius polli]